MQHFNKSRKCSNLTKNYVLSLLSANDSLGAPTAVLKVSAVDLANPDNNVTNEIANTTTPAPTGNNATTVAPTGALIPQLSVREARVQRILAKWKRESL